MGKRKAFSVLMMALLVVSIFANTFIFGSLVYIGRANPGDVDQVFDNTTTLNVTVLDPGPRINWFDFQYYDGANWVSKRNAQIDVDNSNEYRFVVNISSDQGWDDIEYINITAWHDNGTDNTIYNQSTPGDYGNLGPNRNFRLTYENITDNGATAFYNITYPSDEDEIGIGVWNTVSNELIVEDRLNGSINYTQCYNITFPFIPKWQIRYAPGNTIGDGWTNITYGDEEDDGYAKPRGQPGNWTGHDDDWSWDFNITVADSGENNSGNQITTWANDEFGVYSYSEIVSVGWPTVYGVPGANVSAESITMLSRANGNYSLRVNVDDLVHKEFGASNIISNDTVSVRGGISQTFENFSKHDGGGDMYSLSQGDSGTMELYGSTAYNISERNETNKTTDNIDWRVDIPSGTLSGEYHGVIRYRLITETNGINRDYYG